ncbi:MAG: tRNA pseudouridine(55) synthase TruB [Thermogutta sp.]|nr:tRNA pseudouridine(55) synthase TruB [Thermogutta sp.]
MTVNAGILCLNKPPGITSRDAVNIVQRLARPLKVGHAGTLDPAAQGVLVVCVGRATRLIPFIHELPKSYLATFLLGRSSPTDDMEAEVTPFEGGNIPALDAVRAALPRFLGRIEQRPPDYSAVKIAGRRAYDLARRGKTVELRPRTVEIYRIELIRYEYPELELRVECGSGTYIRALGRDLAIALGTRAVMAALLRTAIGEFRVENAVAPRALDRENWQAFLRPAREAVRHLPSLRPPEDDLRRLRNGGMIPVDLTLPVGTRIAVLDKQNELVGICETVERNIAKPLINIMGEG